MQRRPAGYHAVAASSAAGASDCSCDHGMAQVNDRLTKQVLLRMGIESPSWRSLIVQSVADTDADVGHVWATWSDIGNWSAISSLVTDARWTFGDPWRPGSEFVEELDLGFPLRSETRRKSVVSVDPGRSAEWGQSEGRQRTARLWHFEPRPSGGVRISSVAVFHGSLFGIARPFVAKRWRRLLQAQVDALVAAVEAAG